MVNQYLYARTEQGYQLLNDLSSSGFSDADLVNFQDLWMYDLPTGADWHNLPECRYYYNMATQNGMTAIVGKTSFVPAGFSCLSGDRDTTLLHKYLLSGSERERFLNDRHHIFQLKKFCALAEEAESYLKEVQIEEETPQTEISETELLLLKFGITKDQTLPFLYEVMDAVGCVNGRVYITLPDNTKESTDAALRLCERILEVLPRAMAVNCGFLTYTAGFHSASNKIPNGIKLIFIPRSSENRKRYDKNAGCSYIIDPEAGYLPNDKVTHLFVLDILSNMERAFLTGEEDKTYRDILEQAGDVLKEGTTCTPAAFSCAFEFYRMDRERKQGKTELSNFGFLDYIIETFMASETLHNLQGEKDVCEFLKEYLLKQDPGDDAVLKYLCTYCGSIPNTAAEIGRFLSNYLSEHREEPACFERLLKHQHKNVKLSAVIYNVVYHEDCYYSLANIIELMHFDKLFREEDERTCVKKVFERVRTMAGEVPAYASDEDTVSMVNSVLTRILEECTQKGGLCYDVAREISREGRKLAEENPICSRYGDISFLIAGRKLQELEGAKVIPDDILRQLKAWNEEEDEPYFGSDSDYGLLMEEVGEQLKCLGLRDLLEAGEGDECLAYLEKNYEEEAYVTTLRHLYHWHEQDRQELLRNIKFKDSERAHRFYAYLWLAFLDADEENRELNDFLCTLIMESYEDGFTQFALIWDFIYEYIGGHIEEYTEKKPAKSKEFQWDRGPTETAKPVKSKKIQKQEEEQLECDILNTFVTNQLRGAIRRYFHKIDLDNGLLKEMRKNPQFVEDMNLRQYLDKNSISHKLKGFASRIKKN